MLDFFFLTLLHYIRGEVLRPVSALKVTRGMFPYLNDPFLAVNSSSSSNNNITASHASFIYVFQEETVLQGSTVFSEKSHH